MSSVRHPDRAAVAQRALGQLRAGEGILYAVVDAAQGPEVLELVRASGAEVRALHAGRRGERISRAAPHLVAIGRRSPLLGRLVHRGWGRAWAVFLRSDEPLDAVRRHVRRFLVVRIPGGEAVSFRFYDPRVLRVFLETVHAPDRVDFFGPISSFCCEGRGARELLEFRRSGRRSSARAPAPLQMTPALMRAFGRDLALRVAETMLERVRSMTREPIDRGPRAVARMSAALDRAELYGITEERDLERYAEIMAALGVDFDEDPRHRWARTILLAPGSEGSAKVDALAAELHARRSAPTRDAAEGNHGDTEDGLLNSAHASKDTVRVSVSPW